MSAQSLPYPAPSARDLEAQDRTDEAIAFRAKQIADQIRADIAAPIRNEDFAGLDLLRTNALLRRMFNVESVRESLFELLTDAVLATMQRQLVGKHATAMYKMLADLHDKAIAAYAEQEAERQIQAAANDEQ